jgi:ATP-binding cassette subfamily B protein
MKSGTLVKQRDITDCGAACLASIAAHYQLKVPVSRIRQIAGTDKKGTSAFGIVDAAEKMGFSAKGVKGKIDAIPKVPIPAIAHVIIKKKLHHFVVIYKATEEVIKIMDPASGKIESYPTKDFEEIWSGVLIIMMPNEGFQKGDEKTPISARFWYLISPHKSILLQSIIGAAIFTILGLSTAIYVQKIIDFVLPSQNYKLLHLLGVSMIFLLLIQIAINAIKSVFVLKTGQQIDAKLILGYYKHLLTLPQRFFDTMRVGEIISRINDAVKIRSFINEIAIDIIINVFVLLFSFGLMFTYYWKLAMVVVLIIPLYLLIYIITNKLNKRVERKVMEDSAELESQLVESIGSIRTIKFFGIQLMANTKTEFRFVNLLTSVYKSGMNGIFSSNSSMMISRGFTIILLWIGAGYVIDRIITPGELMSFYAIIGYFTGPAAGLIGANRAMQNAKIAADRLFEIMDLEVEEQENKIHIDRDEIGDIHFENVNFRYGTRTTVFEDFNLTIRKGEINAIIGESGCGKTTIISILKKIYPVESGKINIGSYELSSISHQSIAQLIGIVPQKIDLFAGSVMENIAVGEFQPDPKRIMQLVQQMEMEEFINSIPGGLGGHLGEHGVNLSGGQQQKLAILRALYSDPEIILFDEATSALDAKSEEAIIKTMLQLRDYGKTILTISHRLSSVTMADKIVILDKGKIVGEGQHQELLEGNKYYKEFWYRQMGHITQPNTVTI